MTLPQKEDEHRQEHRQRVLKGASILTGINNSVINCTVRNMHLKGAELKIDHEARVPTDFLLYIPVDGVGYRSVVRWRTANRLGVEFTGTEAKPRWHYG